MTIINVNGQWLETKEKEERQQNIQFDRIGRNKQSGFSSEFIANSFRKVTVIVERQQCKLVSVFSINKHLIGDLNAF